MDDGWVSTALMRRDCRDELDLLIQRFLLPPLLVHQTDDLAMVSLVPMTDVGYGITVPKI